MEPKQNSPLSDVHAYLKSKDKDFTADLPTFEQDMQDDKVREQVYDYLKGQDKGFTATFDEFSSDLGVKKKSGGDGGSTTSTSPPSPLRVDPPQMQAALGTEASDIPAGPTSPGLLETPGDEFLAAGLPLPSGEELRARQEARDRQSAEGDGFFGTLGKQLTNLPATLENAAGNVVDYVGDALEPLSRVGTYATPYGVSYSETGVGQGQQAPVSTAQLQAPLRGDKDTDVVGTALRADAATRTTQVSNEAQKSVLDNPTSGAAWGNLLGQGINSVVAVGAASLAGGPAAGVAAGGALGISATKDAAREAGLSDKEAMITATALAPVQGVLEELGVGFITKNKAVTGLLTKTIVGRALKLAGGKLTESGLARAVSAIMPEVVKRGVKAGTAEAVTEFLQGEAEGITKLVADKVRGNEKAAPGQGRYGVSAFDALVKSPIEQAIGGLGVGGLAGGAFHGESQAADAPTEAAPELVQRYVVPGDVASGTLSLHDTEVVGPGQTAGTVQVRGVNARNEIETREVPQEVLVRQRPDPATIPTQPTDADPATLPQPEQQPEALPSPAVSGPLAGNAAPVLAEASQPQQPVVPTEVPAAEVAATPEEVAPAAAQPEQPTAASPSVEPAAPVAKPSGPTSLKPTKADVQFELQPEDWTTNKRGFKATIADASGNEAGYVVGDVRPDGTMRILNAGNTEGSRGKGYGIATYEALAERAEADGLTLTSDVEVSQDAARLYDALERRGYKVTRNPAAKLEDIDGQQKWVSKKGPVFTVTRPEGNATPELLPAAEPHADHVTKLTKQQQAQNDTLDALDRYNALKPGQKKGKEGSTARAEISRAAKRAKIDMTVGGDGKVTLAGGKRLTRANEYTATTPAQDHVPLEQRPAEARPFIDAVLATADTNASELQGLGLKIRGKELSARELGDAVKDIRAGRNSLRAQLVLDALENGHRQGYLEKSTGTGLATRKFTVPTSEYLGQREGSPTGTERELSDIELDDIYQNDPQARQAVDDYTYSDGTINYAKLAADEKGLPFLFDVSDETATKLATLARERANKQPATNTTNESQSGKLESGNNAGEAPQGTTRINEPTPASQQAAEVAAPTLAEQNRAAKQEFSDALAAFRAARKKGSNVVQSSILGIPAFSAEEAAALTQMARAAVKLGAIKTKQIVARLREMGLEDDDATNEQLTAFVKQFRKDEGLVQAKPTAAERPLPPNEPNGTATRSSMARLDADPTKPEALKERVRDTSLDKYEPVSLAETNKVVDDYMGRNSLADAYTEAIRTSDQLNGDVRTALRVRVLQALGAKLTAAVDSGDTASADAYLDQAEKVTEAIAKRGTDVGREINAYKLLVTFSPEAAVYKAQQEVAEQREQASAQLGRKLVRERRGIDRAKREALDNTLATPAVRRVREQVAGKQPVTTQERRAEIRAERADLFAQLKKLTGSLGIMPQQQAIAELHVKIFRSYIQEGIVVLQSLVERIKKDAGPAALKNTTDQQLRQRAAAALGDHNEAIRQGVQALGTTLDQIARDYVRDPAAVGKTLAQQFVAEAGLKPAEAATYAQAIEAEFNRRIAQARQARLNQIEARAQSTTKQRATQSDLEKTRELFALSPSDDAAILDHLKRLNDLPQLTPQDVADLRKLASAIQAAPEGFQRDAAVEQLLKRQIKIKGIKWVDIGSALWYANVLSGYKTHVVNLTANIIQTSSEFTVSVIHSGTIGSGKTAKASVVGVGRGLARGAREAYSVITTGRETSRTPGKYEVPSTLENTKLSLGLKYIGRALRAGDVLFASGLKEMRAYELAVKLALEDAQSNGTPTADVWAQATEKLYSTTQRIADARTQAQGEGLTGNDLERRVYELAEQGRDTKMMDEAREYGTQAVFNGDVKGALGWVATGIQNITEGIQYKGFKPAKYIVPFTRVITNVANAYIDYTPWGVVRGLKGGYVFGGDAKSKLQQAVTVEDRQKTIIKAGIGASVMIAAYALSHMKDDDDQPLLEISGGGTGNPQQDAQLKVDGWQPYSLRVPGTKRWVSYAYTPVGVMLAMVGNHNDGEKYRGESFDDENVYNTMYANAMRGMQFVKDMTALKGAADFLGILDSKNPKEITGWVNRVGSGSVKGYFPWSGLVTQILKDSQAMNGVSKKQGRTFGQMLYQDIPVARNSVNDALDVFGDPLPIDTDRLFSDPPKRDEATQRLWNLLNKHNIFPSVPNKNSGGALLLRLHEGKKTPMTDDEYFRFMRTRGQAFKTLVQGNITQLESMDAETAKRVVKRYGSAANSIAKAREFGPGAIPPSEQATEADE